MEINPRDLTVVVQGAIDPDITPQCLASVRKILPLAQILLSTWEGSDLADLDYDILVLNPPVDRLWEEYLQPNPYGYSKRNSVNNQIISSRAGLWAVKTTFAMKFRTDFIMLSVAMIQAWEDFSRAMPCFDPEWRMFNERILSVSVGSPHGSCALAYHFSDLVQLGLTEDLRRLWDVPLLIREDAEWCKDRKISHAPQYFAYHYACEQKILLDNLDRAGIKYRKPYHYFDIYNEIIRDSEACFLHNFVVIDMPHAGIKTKFDWLLNPFDTFQYRSEHFIRLYENLFGMTVDTHSLLLKYKHHQIKKNTYIKILIPSYIVKIVLFLYRQLNFTAKLWNKKHGN